MSITSTFVRPTNIGGFFQAMKLMRTSLSGVSCQELFRRNPAFGKMSVARSVCGLREFKPSVSSAVRLSGRGAPSLVKEVFAGITPCAARSVLIAAGL